MKILTKKPLYQFFCPLCGQEKKTPHPNHKTSLRNHVQIFLATSFFTLLTWEYFHWKGVVSYFLFWSLTDFFLRLKRRQLLICKSCGFDPFLYTSNPEKMRSVVRRHIQKRIHAESLFQGVALKNYHTAPEESSPSPKPLERNAQGLEENLPSMPPPDLTPIPPLDTNQ